MVYSRCLLYTGWAKRTFHEQKYKSVKACIVTAAEGNGALTLENRREGLRSIYLCSLKNLYENWSKTFQIARICHICALFDKKKRF